MKKIEKYLKVIMICELIKLFTIAVHTFFECMMDDELEEEFEEPIDDDDDDGVMFDDDDEEL